MRHFYRWFTAIILFTTTLTLFGGTSLAADDDNVFRVGMEAGYPPFNWTQQDDSNGAVPIEGSKEFAGGYDVEMAKKIAEGLGKELVIVKTSWDGLPPALTSGKIDAIIAGMSPTEERRKAIDFTEAYHDASLVIMVKKGSPYEHATSLKDFAGAKLTAQMGTLHYDAIDQIEGVQKELAMGDFPEMRVALDSGIIDGYVSESVEGKTAKKVNPNFVAVEFTKENGFQQSEADSTAAIGLRKGSELREDINKILADIPVSERESIMNKAIDQQPDTSNDLSWFGWVMKIAKENWPMFLRGAGMTLFISILGTIIGTAIGMGIGIFRAIPTPKKAGKNFFYKLLNGLFSIYIEIFRGTPMIVQSMVIYYGLAQAFGINMNRTLAAVLIVSINTGAYMTEIVRGGIFSVDKGQFEAAQAIGMTHFQTMRHVVIPQVIRNILPATGNEFVINIKDTSVLNVIAVSELFFSAKTVAGANFRFFETFFIICVIYFVMTFLVTQILRYIERRMDQPKKYYAPYANQMQVQKIEQE
ncbi:ABC transporter permease subunit [Vagococcus zengguangii]|uniref:Transporter substrate-binding domain-containing protein n=1 Tax=Vagococcus zengguangii TaxID=2571750 RepID=A0A4D7CNK6_9ENTE|nr:ABC transporter permease subunit [Vagococcus zengguangii]QCI85655.1 transporter substrate-binding domain-containing protein [Vagococcus zengguangii]TLG81595.1 ABC transporter permease subunit [Vagococcus zengguangii]